MEPQPCRGARLLRHTCRCQRHRASGHLQLMSASFSFIQALLEGHALQVGSFHLENRGQPGMAAGQRTLARTPQVCGCCKAVCTHRQAEDLRGCCPIPPARSASCC